MSGNTERVARKTSQITDIARARDALRAIPPDLPRDEWVEVGFGAIAAGLSKADIDNWSSSADNYKGTKDVEATFRNVESKGDTTDATLFYHARLHGWRDDESSNESFNGHKRKPAAVPKPDPAPRHNPGAIFKACAPATADQSYVKTKLGLPDGVRIYHGPLTIANQSVEGALVLPVRTIQRELSSLQFITVEGKKLFLPGAKLAPDACHVVGGDLAGASVAYVCEGIGQAWSAHQATGAPAVVCFGKSRMAGVANALHEHYPALLVIIPDRGVEPKAAEIAQAVNGAWCELPSDKPPNYDLNDLHRDTGSLKAVAELLAQTKQPDTATDIDDSVAVGKATVAAATAPLTWPEPLDLIVLSQREPQAPREIMDGLPSGYVTGVSGHGGVGKSQIEFLRAVCIASGRPFCGIEVQRRRVLFVSCEDRADILHWRLSRICKYLGINMADLKGWLQVIDLVGHDVMLYAPDPRTGNAFTCAYEILKDRINEYDTEVLFLDGISDTYGGNENARAEVKRFVNMLLALVPVERGAVVLIGHVNKSTAGGIGTSEGYSGSTAWHNSYRARWFLRPDVVQDSDGGAPERTGKLILELQKSNHGEIGTEIEFEWDGQAHLLVGRVRGGGMKFDKVQQERQERAGILAALKACTDHDDVVPAATTGRRTAFHVLSARPEFPESMRSGKPGVRRFWREIEKLRAMHIISDESHRTNDRRYIAKLVLTSEGMRACGQ